MSDLSQMSKMRRKTHVFVLPLPETSSICARSTHLHNSYTFSRSPNLAWYAPEALASASSRQATEHKAESAPQLESMASPHKKIRFRTLWSVNLPGQIMFAAGPERPDCACKRPIRTKPPAIRRDRGKAKGVGGRQRHPKASERRQTEQLDLYECMHACMHACKYASM